MKALLMLVLILIVSCGQDHSKTSNKFLSVSEKTSLGTDCGNVDFHTDVLTKKGILDIFTCLSWQTKFPEINDFIHNIPEDKLNNFLHVPNQLFFKSTNTRDNFLNFVKTNISLSTVLEIKSLVGVLTSSQSTFENLSLSLSKDVSLPQIQTKTLSLVTDSLSDFSPKLLDSLNKTSITVKKNKTFYQSLSPVLHSVVNGFISSPDEFLKMLSSLTSPSINFVGLINSLSPADFNKIFYYPRGKPDLQKNAIRLEEIIRNNEYSCSDITNIYSLNQVQELLSRMHDLKALGRTQFLYSLYDLRLKFTLFNNICYYEELDSLVKVFLDDLIEFSLNPVGFNILKRVAIGSDDEYSLFKYISSEFFSSYQNVVEQDKNNIGMSLLPMLHSLTDEDLELLKNISDELSIDSGFLSGLKPYWDTFTFKEQETLINSLRGILFSENGKASSFKLVSSLLKSYPEMVDMLYKHLEKENFKFLLNDFSKALKNNDLRSELDDFLSYENVEQLLRLFGQNEIAIKDNGPIKARANITQSTFAEPIESCLQELYNNAKENYDFWSLLGNYPDVCHALPENKKEIAHLVFEWTFDIDRVFLLYTGKKFSINYGVISPEMMRYYHELIHLTNRHLDQSKNNYVLNTVDLIANHLFEFGLINIIDSITKITNSNIQISKMNLDKSLKHLIDSDLNQVDKSLRSLFSVESTTNKVQDSYTYTKKLNSNIGEKNNISKKDIHSMVMEARELLLHNNDNSNLLKSIVELTHPDGGVTIPLFQKDQRNYQFNLQEFLLFLHDASSDSTNEIVSYQNASGSISLELTLIQRLELVIREIGFLENFYGAFFINKISKAKDYTKQIKKMKKTLSIIDRTGGLFRRLGVFPNETKWAFKNINQAYDSLWQLNDGGMNYGDLVQSILATTVISSPKRAQSFSAIRKPDIQRVQNHNGKFIKLITENSGLTHLSFFIRENFTRDELINNAELIETSRNFLKLISKKELYEIIELVLSHENFESILSDFIGSEKNILEKLPSLIQMTVDLSSAFTKNELGSTKWVVKLMLDNYFTFTKNNGLSSDISNYFLSFSSMKKPERISALGLLKFVPRNIVIKDDEVKKLLTNFNIYQSKVDNNSLFFRNLVNDNDFRFFPILSMLQSTYEKDGNFEYFYSLIKVLAVEENGSTMLRLAVKKVFVEKSEQLSQFLTDIYARFDDQSTAK